MVTNKANLVLINKMYSTLIVKEEEHGQEEEKWSDGVYHSLLTT